MVGVESITQVLPSFTYKSGIIRVSQFCFFCKTIKKIYLKKERVNVIPSINNEPSFIYLRRRAQNKSCLDIAHITPYFWAQFDKR